MPTRIVLILALFLFFPALVYAQVSPVLRDNVIEAALSAMEIRLESSFMPDVREVRLEDINGNLTNDHAKEFDVPRKRSADLSEERDNAIETTLRNISIELTLEYLFAVHGEQTFEVFSDGRRLSRLWYPFRGEMLVFKGEVRLPRKFFIGGSYGNSHLHEKICSDEDWGFYAWHNAEWKYIEYQISKQTSKSSIEFFNINFYYRIFDLDRDKTKSGKKYLSPGKERFLDSLLINKLSLDVFTGYQQQKTRCGMFDPTTEIWRIVDGSWWYAIGYPANVGLGSFYKTSYRGPRWGFRTEGSMGKFSTRFSFAYALLKTKAYGWWNLRDLTFEQNGTGGCGIDIGLELNYKFTPHFSGGLGVTYLYNKQKEMKESANEAGSSYDDLDIIRNVENKVYSPSLVLRYIW